MRRLIIGCSAAAVLLVGGLAGSTAVQATTPPTEEPAEGPPIVGAWVSGSMDFQRRSPSLSPSRPTGLC